MEGKVLPEDINNGAGVSRSGECGGLGRWELRRWVYYEVNSKEREAMTLRDKLKVVGSGGKDDKVGLGDKVDEWLVVMVVSNISL